MWDSQRILENGIYPDGLNSQKPLSGEYIAYIPTTNVRLRFLAHVFWSRFKHSMKSPEPDTEEHGPIAVSRSPLEVQFNSHGTTILIDTPQMNSLAFVSSTRNTQTA